MADGYKSYLVVGLVLTRMNNKGEEEVLLQLRQNTGFMDNLYDVGCCGHVEKGEDLKKALVREAEEELGIKVDEEALELKTTYHNLYGNRLVTYFSTSKYQGIPMVKEPDECGGIEWFNIKKLPDDMIPYAKKALQNIENGIAYEAAEVDWDKVYQQATVNNTLSGRDLARIAMEMVIEGKGGSRICDNVEAEYSQLVAQQKQGERE